MRLFKIVRDFEWLNKKKFGTEREKDWKEENQREGEGKWESERGHWDKKEKYN